MARKIMVAMQGGETADCVVVESLGFNHDVGKRASLVRLAGREFVAVKDGAAWREWTARDRLSGGRASRGTGQGGGK